MGAAALGTPARVEAANEASPQRAADRAAGADDADTRAAAAQKDLGLRGDGALPIALPRGDEATYYNKGSSHTFLPPVATTMGCGKGAHATSL